MPGLYAHALGNSEFENVNRFRCGFPLFDHRHNVANFPKLAGDASGHRRRYLQRLMNRRLTLPLLCRRTDMEPRKGLFSKVSKTAH